MFRASHHISRKPNRLFYKTGHKVYALRWVILAVWVVCLLAAIPLIPDIVSPFKTTGFTDDHSESIRTERFLDKKLGFHHNNKFIALYHSKTLTTDNPLFFKKIHESLSRLKRFPIENIRLLPKDNHHQISKDKHSAYVAIIIKTQKTIDDNELALFKASITTPKKMTLHLGGEPLFQEHLTQQTQDDLYKADYIATPIAIIILLLIFQSAVAAVLPILLGGGCAVMILSTLYFLGHICNLSIFTLNIALLLGLCLSLDYCLFIINRFRDELRLQKTIEEAIANTEATAGKAVFFSALAVFISLSALLLFPINILFSVAIGGLVAVFFAMLTALVFLPAVLSLLKTRINCLPICLIKTSKKTKIWHRIAETVVRHPYTFFFPTLILLLTLGYPLYSVTLGVSDFHIFPAHSQSRLFFDNYTEAFDENELTPISLLIKSPNRPILSRDALSELYNLTHRLEHNPNVAAVRSIVTVDSDVTKREYDVLYQAPEERMNANLRTLLTLTTRPHFTVVDVISKYPLNSPETKQLLTKLGHIKMKHGMSVQLTGTPTDNNDVLRCISHTLPYAILWIVGFTYLILLFLLRSALLPIKAIAMNFLSLSACYGALVFVFQDGHFNQFLNFEPQHMLDISLLVIIFCAIFGFSMDYEVFLLTRIKEAYDTLKDNDQSIVFGIEKSSKIITSAAIIVIFICGSFFVADVLMVKAFGLGIAVAIFVDAFLIRTILVPATMAIIKSWNWYLPKWLDKILP